MTRIANITLNLNTTDCHSIAELSDNITLQCELIHIIKDCVEDSFIDYADIAFCTLQSKFTTLLLFGTVLAILFLAISITADDFLCPLLVSISKSLNLSDNVAGVTFLALGNGAPDIFSSISGISKNDASLVIGQLYGGGIFVTTIVIGSILIRERFHIMHRPLLRDIMFYLITTSLVFITFRSGVLTLYHSLAFIVIYLFYVLVVILSGIIHRRNERQRALNNIALESNMPGEGYLPKKYQFKLNGKAPSKLSLKALYVSGPGDDFEGVTLRRIKFRKYPAELSAPCKAHMSHPDNGHQSSANYCHHRRLTLYHIGANKLHDHSRKNSYALSEGTDSANNNIILCQDYPRRLTISDTEFPTQIVSKGTENGRQAPAKYESNTIMSEEKAQNNNKKDNHSKHDGPATRNHSNNSKSVPAILQSRLTEVWNTILFSAKKVFHSRRDDDNDGNGNQATIQWKSFLLQICQLNELKQSRSIMNKLLILLKSPIYFLFSLTIPVVDRDLENSGWNRLLILFNILLGPQCFLLITKLEFNLLPSIQLHMIALGVSLSLLPIIIVTSRPETAPPYHIIFAYIGFTIAVAWIYTIANEVVSLLKAVGIVFQISQFLLGLTFLAWGNSLGDLISNLSMAKNGFPRMAISACLGGPVLNMLLGMGIPYSIALLKDFSNRSFIQIQGYGQSNMVTIMFTTITISLVFTILMLVCVTNFASNKIHGSLLYTLYFVFILASIYSEYFYR